jgi:DNA (cytosine-5)-methyltransferase 1
MKSVKQKKIRVVDLFSGCGGMSLGFQNAGFDIVAAFENWAPNRQWFQYV